MRKIDVYSTIASLAGFIQTTVKSAGFSDVVVAVSGGVDSATAASLAVKALGKDHVYALLLPYKNWHDEAKTHAQLLLHNLNIPETHIHEVDISPMVDSFKQILTANPSTALGASFELRSANQLRLGNIMARVRMVVLFDFAKKLNALVLGTENKSEHYLGYYTRFGDEASDLEPLRNLYKTEVWQLAKALGVPQEIISKPPTAGLWQGQTDEGQFRFTYKQADEVMYALFEKKGSEQELIKQGVSQQVINEVKRWITSVSFKHELPYLPPQPIMVK